MAEAPALSVRNLEVRYGAVTAVRNLSLDVGKGEIVGLIGPNGAGKSTTLHAIMGVVSARSGTVTLDGSSVLGRPPEAIAHRGMALVPEGRRIYADFTVEENLRLGLAARRGRYGKNVLAGAYELFPVLRDFRRRQAGVLSGGQQQLVAQPDVLLLDEPSLGLAPALVDDVFSALADIRDGGFAVLLVEQRAQRTVALADRTHVLSNGELRLTLGPEDAGATEKMIAAYFS
jgi:branched-chain amino acid transport system ATP-binding protein